jgi:hypothetical protein
MRVMMDDISAIHVWRLAFGVWRLGLRTRPPDFRPVV